jgi:hypothetical protein
MAGLISEKVTELIRVRNGCNLVKSAHRPLRNPGNLVQKNLGRPHTGNGGWHALSKPAAKDPNKLLCAQGHFASKALIWMKQKGKE